MDYSKTYVDYKIDQRIKIISSCVLRIYFLANKLMKKFVKTMASHKNYDTEKTWLLVNNNNMY